MKCGKERKKKKKTKSRDGKAKSSWNKQTMASDVIKDTVCCRFRVCMYFIPSNNFVRFVDSITAKCERWLDRVLHYNQRITIQCVGMCMHIVILSCIYSMHSYFVCFFFLLFFIHSLLAGIGCCVVEDVRNINQIPILLYTDVVKRFCVSFVAVIYPYYDVIYWMTHTHTQTHTKINTVHN